jgi:hypothetical protein
MIDSTTLSSIVSVAIGLVGSAVLLRAITAGEPLDLAEMFPHPWELDWPRGVQEEEPRPWGPQATAESPASIRPIEVQGVGDEACDIRDAAA